MQAVTTIGLDIAKSVFQIPELTRQECNRSSSAQAPVRFAILSEAAAVPHRHRSLRFVASLVARAQSAGAYGAFDAAGLREALRQAAEERCCRRRGYLRGGHQGKHAVRRDQDTRAAELPDAPSDAPSLHPPTEDR